MNGIHDMGGMHGLGPLAIEADEPVFHNAWEGRAFGIVQAASEHPSWSTDYFRFTRECIEPAGYLTMDYYAQWQLAVAMMYVAAGMLSADELATGRAAAGSIRRDDARAPETAFAGAKPGIASAREIEAPPRFVPGDAVATRNIQPAGHTRLPRYARAKPGHIAAHYGAHVFPDSVAHGHGEAPQHLYSVAIAARDLWGPQAAPKDAVYLDLWESYLEPA